MRTKVVFTFAIIALLFSPTIIFGQTPYLGTAANFSLFTVTGALANTGVSTIQGKIGTNDGAISNYSNPPEDIENANSVTAQAATDLQNACIALFNLVPNFPPHAAVLGNGEILTPGVYEILSAASIEGTITLNAQGNTNALFIFQIRGAFSPGPISKVVLTGGASACNVFWVAQGGAIAMATLSEMKGNFIAYPGEFSMAALSNLEGRGLSTTGAIATDESTVAVPVCMTLPVTLINFKATKEDSKIKLLWTVADEFSLERYQLDRSADGQNFYTIGSVNATNSNFLKTYTWTDETPLTAANLYRLKIIDIDGSFKYSDIVKIDMDGRKELLTYPNPVTGNILQLQLPAQSKGDYTINLYNHIGQKVMNTTIRHDGYQAIKNISLNKNLPGGVYYLELNNKENKKQTTKIIIR